MAVAEWSGSLLSWEADLAALKARLGVVFGRREPREAAFDYLDGLLSGIERKTGWQLAERAGADRPWRIQNVLGRDHWDAEAMGALVRREVMAGLGDPAGVLVVDETGFVKKGEHSVGVARQYTETAGRVENAQVGVFVAYASRFGQTLIDRRLYLPESWAGDAQRRAAAHVPEAIAFSTKVAMARDLIAAALDAGAPCRWVLADALYGTDSGLRQMLEARRQPYVLAVRSNQPVRSWTQRRGFVDATAAGLAADLSAESWARLAAGEGSKGLKLSDWARMALTWPTQEGFERWLLVRRSLAEPNKQAYYLVFAPKGASLTELAGAAGLRWTIEECFERAKSDLGLDHCEARSWHAWHRHMTLVMAAAAFLAKLAADLRRSAFHTASDKANERSPSRIAAA
jgi:SRSO17 transposase